MTKKPAPKAPERVKAARLQMNIHPDMLRAFDDVTHANRVSMTDVTLLAVSDYLKANGIEVNPVWLMAPKHWND